MVNKYNINQAMTLKIMETGKPYRSGNPIAQMKYDPRLAELLMNATEGPLAKLVEEVEFLHEIEADLVPDHPFSRQHATEIGGGTDPMKNNQSARVVEDKILAEGEEIPRDSFVVSKNVICQLNDVEQSALTMYDGTHQYPTASVKKPSVTNPTGIWDDKPQKDFINRVDNIVAPGHVRSSFIVPQEVTAELELEELELEILKVKPHVAAELGFVEGSVVNKKIIQIDEHGVGEDHVRTKAKLGYFGNHSEETMLTGEITPKLDGLFGRLVNKGRKLSLKLRNGNVYTGECGEKDFDLGIEIFGSLHFVITYILMWKGVTNPFSSQKAIVLFNRQKRFSLTIKSKKEKKPRLLLGIPFMKRLPSDGVVVTHDNRQFFYKYRKTADMTRRQCQILRDKYICVEFEDMPEDCIIGEFVLVNGGYRYVRPRPDKAVPNTMANILNIMKNCNVEKLKADSTDFDSRCVELDKPINKILAKIRKKEYADL
jgi:hypothetical protein